MKFFTLVLLIILSFPIFADTAQCFEIEKGKIKFDTHYGNEEYLFKYRCIASLMDDFLISTLSDEEYDKFPFIRVHISRSGNMNTISLRKSGFFAIFTDSKDATARALKLTGYLSRNHKKISSKNNDKYESILSDNKIKRLYENQIDETQKKFLSTPHYRVDNWDRPQKKLNNNTVYAFVNDSIYVYCKKRVMLKLNSITDIIKTAHLGTFIFDTDSSFYYLNPYFEHLPEDGEFESPLDYERNIVFGKLTQRYIMSNAKSSNFKLLEEDLENHRVCFYYNKRIRFNYPGAKSLSISGNFTTKKKFMYLINDEILIPRYDEIENEKINNIKKDYR